MKVLHSRATQLLFGVRVQHEICLTTYNLLKQPTLQVLAPEV